MKTLSYIILLSLFTTFSLAGDGGKKDKNSSQKERKCTIQILPINSAAAEFCPVFYKNGLIFCSTRQSAIWSGLSSRQKDMDLYYTERKSNNSYTAPRKLRGDINTRKDEGPFTITADGKFLYFTKTKSKRQKNEIPTLGIFSARLDGKEWKDIRKFPHNVHKYNVAHPALSADGQTLYFSADLHGGYGGTDLYVCHKVGSSWTRPQNLGPAVNTWGNEQFPFVHPDGMLYFSSDGHSGMGGLDVFYTREIRKDQWLVPKNYGEPVNSEKDDFGIVVSEDKRQGYFSSNRRGGFGKDDIYAFTIEGEIREDINETPGPLMIAVNHEVRDFEKNTLLNDVLSLKSIHFGKQSFRLTPIVADELNKVIRFLKENPNITQIELGAHTDARGNDEQNERLSVKRASEARAYLMLNGISIDRIKVKGYGESKLLNKCQNGITCPEDVHQENDRLEVKILDVEQFSFASLQSGGVPIKPTTLSKPIPPIYRQENTNTNIGKERPPQAVKKDKEKKKKKKKNKPIAEADNYLVHIGPFETIDNRVYYECKQLKGELNIQYTPNGRMLVLGPYDNLNLAKQEQTNIEKLGIRKTKLVKGYSEVDVQKEIAKLHHNHYVVIGHFKHVDNDTYYKFARLNTPIKVEHAKSGMTIVLGPYVNNEEAEHFRSQAMKHIATPNNRRQRNKIKAEIEVRSKLAGSGKDKFKNKRKTRF